MYEYSDGYHTIDSRFTTGAVTTLGGETMSMAETTYHSTTTAGGYTYSSSEKRTSFSGGGGILGGGFIGNSSGGGEKDPKKPASASNPSPWQVGWEWLTGIGPRHRNFTNGDQFT